jgi:pyrroline-5-carboxylate reductase
MALDKKLAFLGAGNMAEALIKGLLRAKMAEPGQITATGRRTDRLDELKASYGVVTTKDNVKAVEGADVVVLAVKPQAMSDLLDQIAPHIGPQQLLLSVAAGVPIGARAPAPSPRAATPPRPTCRWPRPSSTPSASRSSPRSICSTR